MTHLSSKNSNLEKKRGKEKGRRREGGMGQREEDREGGRRRGEAERGRGNQNVSLHNHEIKITKYLNQECFRRIVDKAYYL